MHLNGVWLRAALVALLAATAAHPIAAQPGGDARYIVADKQAILLMPPELVAGPTVDEAVWSPDGEYVLATQTYVHLTPDIVQAALKPGGPPPSRLQGEVGLVLWTRKTGQSQVLWRQGAANGSITGVRWLPGTSVAVADAMRGLPRSPSSAEPQRERVVLRIHAPTGIARVVVQAPESGYLQTYVSPTDGIAVVDRRDLNTSGPAMAQTLVAISATGAPAPVRPPDGLQVFALEWAQGGSALLRCRPDLPAPDAPRQVILLLDPRKGTIQPAQGAEAVAPPPPAPSPFAIKQGSAEVRQDGSTQTVTPLWLEITGKAERPRVLLSAEGQWASVSPRGNAVLYKAQGALWAASLLTMPRAAFDAAREAALRTVVLSNAKQVGLALLMWAQDNGNRLPGSDYSTALLSPYLKNDRLFDGFQYTFPGGPFSDIERPAETEIGFITGPGGRAVLYADGHVKWRND